MIKKRTEIVERTLVDDILEEMFVQLSARSDFDSDLLQELKIAPDSERLTKPADIQALVRKAASRKSDENSLSLRSKTFVVFRISH